MSKTPRAKLPSALAREPKTNLEVERARLDSLVYAAVERVAANLLDRCDSHLRMTTGHLLRSLKLTHQSMVTLVVHGKQEHSGDLLPLTRLQVERVFACMLLAEDPDKWLPKYRKAAWKAEATRHWRNQAELGHFDCWKEFKETLEREIYDYARAFDVTPDEVETLRAHLNGVEPDPKYRNVPIHNIPNAADVQGTIQDPALKVVAQRFYLTYNDLCSYSHSGLLGVMIGGLLGGHIKGVDQSKADTFFYKQVIDLTLPCSYVCMMTAATLFALPYRGDPELAGALIKGWSPYVCDATTLGIVVWDAWARNALGVVKE